MRQFLLFNSYSSRDDKEQGICIEIVILYISSKSSLPMNAL